MKNFLYLLLFVSLLSIAQSKETIENELKDKCYFQLGATSLRFENGFILANDKKNNKKLYHFTVLGDKINFKISDPNQKLIKSGKYFYDASLRANKELYKIVNLEIKVLKNNKIVKNWTLITQTKRYSDSLLSPINKSIYIENGYLPYSGSLVNGDKIEISLRKKGQNSFIKWNFEKKEGAKKPFIISAMDNDLKEPKSFESFIQESIDKLRKDNFLDKSNFFDDYPENSGLDIGGLRNRHFIGEKYCLVFRKPNGKKRTYDSFEYRNTVNAKTGEWIKSNGFIFLDLNESGADYKLEVRYKYDPKYVAVYNFNTEPDWYQTLWFKIVIGIFSLLIFSLIYIVWMRKKAKRKQLEQKSKIKTLYAQLNPHFVFNALGSIQGLLNDNQIEKANQYLVGFGSLLRNTLTSSEKEIQSLEIEIKSINNYIELEQLRNPFLFRLTIDEKIDVREVQTLPLLMQPLIENAIKHGISNKEKAEITITISKKGDDLIFELADNGKGFDTLAEQKGFGLKLVKDRISLFNQSTKKMKIDMKIQSNSSGTQISICYKNWLKND